MVSVVKDPRGETLNEILGAHFPSIAEIWLFVDEFEIEFIELLSGSFIELKGAIFYCLPIEHVNYLKNFRLSIN